MQVIALTLAVMMTILYFKSIKGMFKSSLRIKEDFDKTIDKLTEETGEEIARLSLLIVITVLLLFSISYYIITASAVGSVVMTILASIHIVFSIVISWRLVMYTIDGGKFKYGFMNRFNSWVGLIYLIMFYISFFS